MDSYSKFKFSLCLTRSISICHLTHLGTCVHCPCGFTTLSTLSSALSLVQFSRPTSLPFSTADLSLASPSLTDFHLLWLSRSHLQSAPPNLVSTCSQLNNHLLSPFHEPGTDLPGLQDLQVRSSRILQSLRGRQDSVQITIIYPRKHSGRSIGEIHAGPPVPVQCHQLSASHTEWGSTRQRWTA